VPVHKLRGGPQAHLHEVQFPGQRGGKNKLRSLWKTSGKASGRATCQPCLFASKSATGMSHSSPEAAIEEYKTKPQPSLPLAGLED